eukprot:m.64573 g.64573  ORF g.64573 m.64573 type:complete len:114 (+) comp15890_c0_seq1:350-691(+)
MSYDLEDTHETLAGRFRQIFLWHAVSSLAVHTILGLRLAFNFRKDLGSKWALAAIIAFPVVNFVFIALSGAMTSYLIAQVYDSSDQPMPNWNAIIAGLLTTMVNIVIGYTQID